MTRHPSIARALIPMALAAGGVAMKHRREGFTPVRKRDGSPVTPADREMEVLITHELSAVAPGIPVVGEEAFSEGIVPDISSGTFFLTDPLDGTRDYISGGNDFTVNIALCEDFIPVAGVIYAPALDALYFADAGGAFRVPAGGREQKISVRPAPPEGLTVVSGSRHTRAEKFAPFLRGRAVRDMLCRAGAIKFCLLAAGEADFYPRLGASSEWDTAAGEAILRAAGGRVADLDGRSLRYGKASENFENPGFMAEA